jgi:Protein of unknown function (DUF4232)
MAAVAAFVGTAALAIALTRAPAHRDVSLSSDVSSQACATSGLEAWLGTGAAAGRTGGARIRPPLGTYYTLEFTNVSDRTCSLYGYPEVSAYRDSAVTGRQIGGAAIRNTSVHPQPVMLAPGATAHAVLRVTVTASPEPASCAQVTAAELRVILPRHGQPAFVPAHIPVCANRHMSLSVQAIQARPGVPGYTVAP